MIATTAIRRFYHSLFKPVVLSSYPLVRTNLISESLCGRYLHSSKIMDQNSYLSRCRDLAPPLTNDRHKGQAGRIGIFGGSLEYTGAPYYAAISSLKVGSDLSYVFCMKDAALAIKSYSPELIVFPFLDHPDAAEKIKPLLERLHVVVIGPGLGRDPTIFNVIAQIINHTKELKLPLVIDADGLFFISQNKSMLKDYPAKVILTPNVMEFSRLTQGADGQGSKKEKASSLFGVCPNLTVLCKGPEDEIFDSKVVAKVSGGGSGRRCGGQGDLISGATATFFAWALQTNIKDQNGHDDRAILAAFAACKLVRTCNERGFRKFGRSMTVLDMIPEIHGVFDEYFERQ